MTTLRLRTTLCAAAMAATVMLASAASRAQTGFTDWGWPQPYQKVSDTSVAWLKDKGWWPLGVAWQGPFSGQNAVNVVMDKQGLLTKRGIESGFKGFGAGPDVNEAIASGRAQVGNGGNFPFTSLLDRGVPVKAIAIVAPNLEHSVLVPKDSKLTKLADLKGSNPPATIGIVTGSSAEFYFTQAAEITGLTIGKDVILKNMPIAEQLLLPGGVAAVVPWEPSVSIVAAERKSGRVIDRIFPYNFYQGSFYVRQELIDNVPDVVQAISDAFMEATLWIRLNPEKTADLLAAEPLLRSYNKDLLLDQVRLYNNLYKPTAAYPFAGFWGTENARIARWLKERGRMQKSLSAADYAAAFETRFMDHTLAVLGWTVPTQPPFLPRGWEGKVGNPPYPAYPNADSLKTPQPWPEKGDLMKAWSFGGKTYQP
ncbi:ABC transporter substrate-binding protein [Azospirillum sp. RWY-5-1]|uniref:ABC transporter substrate-binding protein n=1 Tax=Azospirillum oleiclasticum TaxID=2735135 RepID=A0ABX2TM08_9PROT|nr:ABC transporter substrate-binding protein [Azospirillum oleiclasticum]NYZ17126.1 ABC transporter substrate-binding protein [Azospirillum oleiclasticum]NYZ24263.1 ABC transporter substrate-binding protein [Azospirillum oleiclasticum]